VVAGTGRLLDALGVVFRSARTKLPCWHLRPGRGDAGGLEAWRFTETSEGHTPRASVVPNSRM